MNDEDGRNNPPDGGQNNLIAQALAVLMQAISNMHLALLRI